MRRPLPIITLLLIAGILLGRFVPAPLGWLLGAASLVTGSALFHTQWRAGLLWPSVVFLGWVRFSVETSILCPHDLRTVVGDRIEFVTLRGALCETPVQRVYQRDPRPSWRSLAQLEVRALGQDDDWRLASGRVAVSTPGRLDSVFFHGQAVEVTGVLRPPRLPMADGLFDYRAYLQLQNIYYELAVEGTNEWRLTANTNASRSVPWSDHFLQWAQRNLARGLPEEDEPLRLLWAMTLGWKTALTGEVSEPFMRNGTLHIFAISGLHIALIAGILVQVLRFLQAPRAFCGAVVVPALWFYTAATGWQPSAIRSTIMMSIIIGGWALKRPSDLLNSLAAAGLIILLWEPQQIFQAGFQLSFFVVLSIALFLPPLERLRQRLLQTDPFLPPELRPHWQRSLDVPVRYVTTSAATSLAAWLGSLPLIAHYFHLLTPVSLLANLLIVPLSGLALMASLGSLLCGDWLPWLTVLFNHSAWLWMKLMIELSVWTAGLPGAYFYIRAPSLLQFVFYYLILAGTLSGWLLHPARRKWTASGIAAMATLWAAHGMALRNDVCLTVLPLGGGPMFADLPGRENDLLIDCGNRAAMEFTIKPFLRAQGVNRLSQVLLTHGDLHRVGGLEHLDEQFSPRRVITSPVRFRSPTYRRIVESLTKNPGRWRRVIRGDAVAGWKVLHPAADDRFAQADDNAIVLLGEFHRTRIVLVSDLGRLGQRRLLERESDLRADLVVTGIPSQGEALSAPLIEAIRPSAIIVANAEYPSSARASPRLRERLARMGCPTFYTSETGAVTVRITKNGWELETMNQAGLSGKPGGALPSDPAPVDHAGDGPENGDDE